MQPTHIIRAVLLRDISDSGLFDLHPFLAAEAPPADLVRSIRHVGVLCPPTLLETQEEKYEVISGRRRLKAVAEIDDRGSLYCRVLPGSTDIKTILTTLLEDQFRERSLSVIEQTIFVELCRAKMKSNNDVHHYLDSLLPDRITFGTRHLDKFTNMPHNIQRMVHDSTVAEKAALSLLHFPLEDQSRIAQIIDALQLGVNKQKQLIDGLLTLSKLHSRKAGDILEDSRFHSILSRSETPAPVKGELLLNEVHAAAHPLHSEMKKSFRATVQQLGLPQNVSLQPSPFFERDEVTYTARFAHLDDFITWWKQVQRRDTPQG